MGRLKAIRTSLRKQLRSEEVHEFARIVEELGYADYRSVEREKADFAGLVGEALRFYRRLLKTHGADAAARPKPGPTLSRRLKLAPRDATFHENLRVAPTS
jgi:hypothetical protein